MPIFFKQVQLQPSPVALFPSSHDSPLQSLRFRKLDCFGKQIEAKSRGQETQCLRNFNLALKTSVGIKYTLSFIEIELGSGCDYAGIHYYSSFLPFFYFIG